MSSVEAIQARSMRPLVTGVAARPDGTEGAAVSAPVVVKDQVVAGSALPAASVTPARVAS